MRLPKNPWLKLPKKNPYVLDDDAEIIKTYNKRLARKKHSGEKRIRLNILPEPFLGRPDAPVVLLNLNPGYTKRDKRQHTNRQFKKLWWDNIRHCKADYPFYLLAPKINRTLWWERILGPLIDRVGIRTVAQNILCVEFFPYHSKKFGSPKQVPSQEYSFSLVRDALRRNAFIVIMRRENAWFKEIRRLKSYPKKYYINSSRNPVISPANCRKGFTKIVHALRVAAQ